MPYSWLKSLRDPQGRRFLRDSLERYGYLEDDGRELPVGFTTDRDRSGVVHVGQNCAACHVREIVVDDETYRIDGAPGIINAEAFHRDLQSAFAWTIADSERFDAFIDRAIAASRRLNEPAAGDRAEVRAKILEWFQLYDAFYSATLPSSVSWGIGRIDALNQIFSRVAARVISPDPHSLITGNLAPANRPVKPPFLWNVNRHDYTQWGGNIVNGTADLALKRNYSQNLGVDGEVRPVLDPSVPGGIDWLADNSTDFDGLARLERLVSWIGPPEWPWRVNRRLARRGAEVFAAECASCHGIQPGEPRPGNPDVWATPVHNVGTDPTYFTTLVRTGDSGVLSGQLGPTAPIAVLVNVVNNASLRQHNPAINLNYVSRGVTPGGFESRVLQGIWAAAPYLHNGSVPTLADLLKPASERPQQFQMGNEYDVRNIGLARHQEPRPGSLFDTTLTGNSNAGHEFGTTLPESDKAALLEFLKKL